MVQSTVNEMSRTIEVTPLSRHVGAEIRNVDIAAGISDQQFDDIRQAFIDYGVIFFRDQVITPDQHIAFAERWGNINVNRFFNPVKTHPIIAEVRKEPHQKGNAAAIGGDQRSNPVQQPQRRTSDWTRCASSGTVDLRLARGRTD